MSQTTNQQTQTLKTTPSLSQNNDFDRAYFSSSQHLESERALLAKGIDLNHLTQSSYEVLRELSSAAVESEAIISSFFNSEVNEAKRLLRKEDQVDVQEALRNYIDEGFNRLASEYVGSNDCNYNLHKLRVAFELLNAGTASDTNKESTDFAQKKHTPDTLVLETLVESLLENFVNTERLSATKCSVDLKNSADSNSWVATCAYSALADGDMKVFLEAKIRGNALQYSSLMYPYKPAGDLLSLEVVVGNYREIDQNNLNSYIPKNLEMELWSSKGKK